VEVFHRCDAGGSRGESRVDVSLNEAGTLNRNEKRTWDRSDQDPMKKGRLFVFVRKGRSPSCDLKRKVEMGESTRHREKVAGVPEIWIEGFRCSFTGHH